MYSIAALLDPDEPTTLLQLTQLGLSETEVRAELRRLIASGEAEEVDGGWVRKYPKPLVEVEPVRKVAKGKDSQRSLFDDA
jgi:hypothetical protein